MKYTIEGFSQEQAVKLGLNVEDLSILRWFVDFWPSEKMVKMVHDGKTYAFVSYKYFIEQMPIIGCNKRTIARKFQRLVEAGVLENITIKQGGSFSVYRFGENYDSLVYKPNTVVQESTTVVQESTTGMDENVQPPMYKNVQPNIHLSKYIHPSNNNIPLTPKKESKANSDCPNVLELFSSTCSDLPKPQKLTDSRKKAIARVEKDIEEFGGWEKFFKIIQQSDFLSGRKSDWKADFDWVLKPNNMVKIMEGNYSKDQKKEEPQNIPEWISANRY